MEFSVSGLWHSMGLAAQTVVVLLGVLSVYSIAIMVERGLLLRRTRRESAAFTELVNDPQKRMELRELLDLTNDPQMGKSCYLARIVRDGLAEAVPLMETGQSASLVLESAQTAVSRSVIMTVIVFRRRLAHLASTASDAPFLGLFGTVLGLIKAFRTIATTGSGGMASVSSGISEALITTLVGLFVAIPALWGHNAITDSIEALAVELDNTAARVVDRVLKRKLGVVQS